MILLYSRYTDPVYNLACEAYLHGKYTEDFLFLYRNARSVIVGRNQCAAAETDLQLCAVEHIPVIRRISGGGGGLPRPR
ncbi:MAG: hypothetical protein LIO77_03900 [Rikenellaceae bacterium]|nr:hypothetical protein [Rikenellaceae bacterium]